VYHVRELENELQNKLIRGILVQKDRPEYIEEHDKITNFQKGIKL